MSYFFTSESVSEGHPDKIADQISDALVDHFLASDPESKVACETLVTTGQVILAGEVKSSAYLDLQNIAREVINQIGYNKSEYMFDGNSCGVLTAIHEQSPDINQGVDRATTEMTFETKAQLQGAGDQGIMFGYATNETEHYMPLALDLAHSIMKELAQIRKEKKKMIYLRPDAKSQVTIEYSDDHKPIRIVSIVVSTQHDNFGNDQEMLKTIEKDIKEILIPKVIEKQSNDIRKLFNDDIKYFINPTGKFVIGGPHGDTGLTGRKIIVDTYGGKGAHGGGAFSGKDPSKVDRSAAYAARYIAKNMVAAGVTDEILIQLSYAIGEAEPTGVYVNTYNRKNVDLNDGEIAEKIKELFDLRPFAIEQYLKLRNPIYQETASYGHMGREPFVADKTFNKGSKNEFTLRDIEFFTWEKLDLADKIKTKFGLT
ncbi:MAG: methionine adenosyltransferase [Weeksellaceae bacterium]|nr:methionine adenosyltransferase [Weeksellaceae bacterium]